MAITYRTANILAIAILGSTAKFNARQYFRLYGIYVTVAGLLVRKDTQKWSRFGALVSFYGLYKQLVRIISGIPVQVPQVNIRFQTTYLFVTCMHGS